MGKITTKTMTMPKPPSHWLKLRQKAMAAGMESICSAVITVEPVVVRPETDSKKASTGDVMVPSKRNGSAPATPPTSHASPTVASPSRRK